MSKPNIVLAIRSKHFAGPTGCAYSRNRIAVSVLR